MIVSSKGRYALRIMIDLAKNQSEGLIPMKTVAKRQGLSLKYLERILPFLTKNKYVEGVSGKGGGYRLTRKPEDYKVGEILRKMEGNLAPVTCLESHASECTRKDTCPTLNMWKGVNKLINDYLDGITIADLMSE